ncbi:MAG: low molecular weight phosphotyrosine protein phosphatase [Clostridia bacterium]|nr:low molecular weight phosphotyrosine protein phosphatase [Clostridia bacterium]
MMKIMFVCHGNICRSPMAEFIFKKIAAEAGLSGEFTVCSSATSTEEIWNGVGKPVYPPAKEELKKHGITCEGKRAVQLTKADYGKYDLFIGMDSANIRNMHRILGGDPDGKIRKLMDYTDRGGDVADPWYSDRFDIAYRDIYDGCVGLLRSLTNKQDVI